MTTPVKTYWVQDQWGEGYGRIEFARHAVVARRNGSAELDVPFGNVSCRREPKFDQYADQGEVPATVLLANGWWYPCAGFNCTKLVYGDTEGHVVTDTHVYCSQECCDRLWPDRRSA